MELFDTIVSCMENLPSFIELIENKDIVLYLGLTRSGKSTLINCIIGTPLQCSCIPRGYKITKVNDDDPGPEIGEGLLSSTCTPDFYPYNDSFIMDAPGFLDNRVNQEVINALFLKQVRRANTCKFVLVIDINEIVHTNKQLFLNSLESLVSLVQADLSDSLSLVFTKTTSDDNLASIRQILVKIIEQDQLDITPEVRRLLRGIVERPQIISFFPMPTQEGPIVNVDLLEGHDNAVSACRPLNVKDVTFNTSISKMMLVELSELFTTLCDTFDFLMLSDFPTMFGKYLGVKKYVYASTDSELDQAQKDAYMFERKVTYEKQKRFTTIQDVGTSFRTFSSLDASHLLFRVVQVFAEFENLTTANVMIEKYKACFSIWHKYIRQLIEKIKNEKEYRKERDLKFKIEGGVIGAGVAVGILGGIGARVAVTEAVSAMLPAAALTAIPFVGVAIGVVGGLASLVTAGITIKRHIDKQNEIEDRMKERVKQGRPVPEKYLQKFTATHNNR